MIRKMILCALIVGCVIQLCGCGKQNELKEEDMVKSEYSTSQTILTAI